MKKDQHQSAGAWAKRYHLASRQAIEAILRPYDLGSTQWYVLWQLIHVGPTLQRDFLALLQIEKATLSGVVSALVRKGLVSQAPDTSDLRQKRLSLTPTGLELWKTLPNPIEQILNTAFEGVSESDLDTTVRVLSMGTGRLNDFIQNTKGKNR